MSGAQDEDSTATAPASTVPPSKFEGNQNRFRIYFESPPELDRIPKAIRRGNKRWRRESSSVAPSVAPARAAQPEDTVEEEVQPQATEADVPAADKAEGAKDAQQVLSQAGEVAEGEIPASTAQAEAEEPAQAVNEDSSEAQAVDLAISDPEAAAENATSVPAEATENAPPTENANGDADQAADDADLAGDVSMITDPGVLADSKAVPSDAQEVNGEPPSEGATVSEDQGPTEPVVAESAEVSSTNAVEAAQSTSEPAASTSAVPPVTTAEADAEILAKSAEATASAYSKARARRRSSVSSTYSHDGGAAGATGASQADDSGADGADSAPKPSFNRVSVLYEHSSRRLIFDAEAIKKVRIFRSEGKIEVTLQKQAVEPTSYAGTDKQPKGVLVSIPSPIWIQ